MSYKKNQADPTRRARILARSTDNSYKEYDNPTRSVYGKGPMKISRRNALARVLTRRFKAGSITRKVYQAQIDLVFSGYASRTEILGFKPT